MDGSKYIDWKNWIDSSFGLVKPGSQFYFGQIFQTLSKSRKNILEIGFGNGELLGYFHSHGHSVVGVEINGTLVARAKEAGYRAYFGDVCTIEELATERFDVIAAFSVAEHMNVEQLNSLFLWIGDHLAVNGRLYLVFPEGASPFGLINQNGDFTHVTCLTKSKIEALCELGGMELIAYKDEPLFSNKLCSWGLLGKIILLMIQLYANIVRKILIFLLYPLATGLRLGVNSVAVIALKKKVDLQ